VPFVLELGQVIGGRYTLDRMVAAGGMGEIWAAHDEVTSSVVAVKFVRRDRLSDDARRRLLKEARASSAVNHPAVVAVRDVVESEAGEPALVMELLQGESLEVRSKPIEPRECARLLLPVAEALAVAHAAGIVHRDLKPENIFLTTSGDVKVLDFGIAKQVFVDAETAASVGTQTGAIIGTPQFMSPEQAFAERDIDHRTDIWSLGLVLYECLTGLLPTRADSLGQVLKIIVTENIPSIFDVAPNMPRDLGRLVNQMVQRQRDARPDSMNEVVTVLRAAVLNSAPPSSNDVVLRVGNSDSTDAWDDTQGPSQATTGTFTEDSTDSFLQQIAAMPDKGSAHPEPQRTGERIAHYEVAEKIGQGGMGIVYAAQDVRLHRKVALKILPVALVANEERRRRFLREARSASAVQHANVATVYDVGESSGTVYIAMEHVEGKTLRAVLKAEGGPLKPSRGIDIATQMAKGLARAHEAGVIHRDVKPENVMISADGTVKILDFGLAKVSREAPVLQLTESADTKETDDLASRVGRVLGTPAYMSPEQAAGGAVDARTDVYAMGVVLHEMLGGARPMKRHEGMDTAIRSHLSPEAARIIEKCLKKSPEERYPSARELLEDLVKVEAGPSDKGSSRRSTWMLVGGLAIAATGIGVWWRTSSGVAGPAPSMSSTNTVNAEPPLSAASNANNVIPPTATPAASAALPAEPAPSVSASANARKPGTTAPLKPVASAASTVAAAPGTAAPSPTLKPQTW
jgi:serine/threonine protein kinase